MSRLKSIYYSLADKHPRLHKALGPWVVFAKCWWLDLKRAPRQLLQIDIVRSIICFPRYIVLFVILGRVKIAPHGAETTENTLAHNMRGSGELSAPRSHLLIRPIISLDRVARNVDKLKVLTIGPRVEGEIYNLMGYGFRGKNIRGLDLFSFSPYIDVGDMHAMDYPDNSFDIVISGWVLGYSDAKQRCADEMIRVCKPGGIIALGNGYYEMSPEEVIQSGGLAIGSNEKVTDLAFIKGLFNPEEDAIAFQYDGARDRMNGAPLILVYEVRK